MASKRGYLTQDELAEFAEINITDEEEADDQISMAEELIDDYVGPQRRFFHNPITGMISAISGDNKFTLDSNFKSSYPYVDQFVGLFVEIIGGPGIGQMKKITASSVDGELTIEGTFGTAVTIASFYKIFQLGKFPRIEDVHFNSYETPHRYYKSIPEAVKRATAAQVEYRINMGDSFFASGGEEVSERIGDYSYSRKNPGGTQALIAPKARFLLRDVMNRTGKIIID